ncbi:hypothetical protein H4R18_005458 [Coemansia javaensis]|uniref:DNA mismatch repair proteins mutS family domain-containing protein n=1 Tax=Coemansia javaensis TaxID=2761396 RepID=A0A9W8H927_9FUNG|nr:hypothetical protein H4R18_005458 [Coemansia javaensis]
MAKYETLAAVHIVDQELGAAVFDALTKRLLVVSFGRSSADSSIQTFVKQAMPDAVLYPESNSTIKCAIPIDKDEFEFALGEQRITRVNAGAAESTRGLLREEALVEPDFAHSHRASVGCAGAIIGYLEAKHAGDLDGAVAVVWELENHMEVDQETLSYLHVFDERRHPNMHSQSKRRETTSLFTLLNKTRSAAGHDLLRKWVLCPLQALPEIHERQEAVSVLLLEKFAATLKDIQQTLSKARSVRAACLRIRTELHLVDLESLAQFSYVVIKLHQLVSSMGPVPRLIQELLTLDQSAFVALGCMIIDTVDFDASRAEERVVVAANASTSVDRLREQFDGLEDILSAASVDMEAAAGVPVTAVYFPQLGFLSSIDVSHFWREAGAEPRLGGWTLKFQTDKQRYYKNHITNDLDLSPGDVFSQLNDAEAEVLLALQGRICAHIPEIARAAELVAQLDCLQSLAAAAALHGYCRPEIDRGGCHHIVQGRHPVIESCSAQGFIANDAHLPGAGCTHDFPQAEAARRALVIVGPNASGKSVLAKQTALVVYMAHVGGYVPATRAVVGLTDRIAAMGRASESLAQRQSALSADLKAVAGILARAGPSSLVLLDEFGRGTSPTDGLALLCGALAQLTAGAEGQPACVAVTHFQGTAGALACAAPVAFWGEATNRLWRRIEVTSVRRIRGIWHKARVVAMQSRDGADGPVHLFR